MSTCCDNNKAYTNNTKDKASPKKANCPNCQHNSRAVSRMTLLQQISFPYNIEISKNNFYYCGNLSCDLAYFSVAGQHYNYSHLRLQHDIINKKLCYCFDISIANYQQAQQSGSAARIKDFVVEQTKSQHCACEGRNPSGQCCLADFKRIDSLFDNKPKR